MLRQLFACLIIGGLPLVASAEILGTIEVTNHTNECLRIFVDGRYVGTVHEGTVGLLRVHSHAHENVLDAYCEEDGELIRHAHFHGHAHFVRWHIDP